MTTISDSQVESNSADKLTNIELIMQDVTLSCTARMLLVNEQVTSWNHATVGHPFRGRASRATRGWWTRHASRYRPALEAGEVRFS